MTLHETLPAGHDAFTGQACITPDFFKFHSSLSYALFVELAPTVRVELSAGITKDELLAIRKYPHLGSTNRDHKDQ